MKLELDIQNPFEFTHLPSDKEFQAWAYKTLQIDAFKLQEVSVVIRVVDETESQKMNHVYRRKNAPTNVLSFPFEMPDLPELEIEDEKMLYHLGDLVFCEPIIKEEALEQNKDLFQHWAHLVIHGMLHLQGYDHIDDDDAERMESLEINMMQLLKFPNPYE